MTEAVANLQEATPVATGWARANWLPSVGQPATDVVGAPGQPDASATESGLARVLTYKLGEGDAFIANNVPYISVLDGGSSTQAPAGFVDVAVDKAVQTVGQQLLDRQVKL